MNIENNPCISPVKEDCFNPLKALNQRVGALEKAVNDLDTEINTANLTVTEDVSVGNNLTVGNNITIEKDATVKRDLEVKHNLDVENLATIKTLDVTNGGEVTLDEVTATDLNVNGTANVNTLDVTNGGNLNITRLTVENTIKNPRLVDVTPIESEYVVGYDANGTLIPVHAVYDTGTPIYVPHDAQFIGSTSEGQLKGFALYDYIVDSQDKFDDLMSLAKSNTGVTYKNIAIIGGLGDGTNGEYVYNVSSSTTDGDFNNANVIGYKSAKININLSNVDVLNVKLFDFIERLENVEIKVSGTVVGSTVVTVLADSNIYNSTITLTNDYAFHIYNCKLNNVVNNKYLVFESCELHYCDTIQSEFSDCTSDILYVATNSNVNKKYKFTNSGLHLDIRQSTTTQTDTVTINILSMATSSLTCLDKSSVRKQLIINCDDCDVYSKIIGNNDNKALVDSKPINNTTYYVEPANITKAYISLHDVSRTPIYSNDGTNFYLDSALTASKKVTLYVGTSNSKTTYGFKLGSTGLYYTNLKFLKTIAYDDTPMSTTMNVLNLTKDTSDGYIKNNAEVKSYVVMFDSTRTTLYSNNNGTNMYLDADCSATKEVKLFVGEVNSHSVYGFTLGTDNSVYYTDLTFSETVIWDDFPDAMGFSVLYNTIKNKNDYAVQVNSTSGDYMNVKDAYLTTVLS